MKISPTLKQFKQLAKENNLIVFSHKFSVGCLTPLSVYHGLAKKIKRESFLLESVEGQDKVCRYSFLGFKPICTFKSRGKTIYLTKDKVKSFKTKRDPCFELKRIMSGFRVAPKENLRFFGGFVGYLGYDLVRFYEPIGKNLPDVLKDYDTYLILSKFLIIFDHLKAQIEILSFVPVSSKNQASTRVYEKEREVIQDLHKKIINCQALPELTTTTLRVKPKSNFKKEKFIKAVKKAKEYIRSGEIIQAVLSQRFSVPFKGDTFKAYRQLRKLNPSPYMFYLNFAKVKLCGASPEMLLRCEKKTLFTHPIAGTRKRGRNYQEDKLLEKSLLADPKEKAEHIMLVDLARNDLGRVAKKATVTVSRFMEIGRFSHVMHIVSEVQAKLKPDEDIFSSLISCFPAGTVSGAPKVRAMQIINELEPDRRGIYAGCVGYFSFTKSLDTCIIIRTIVFKGQKAYIQAGAGIVADSVPAKEYKEIVNKAKAQMLAVELAH